MVSWKLAAEMNESVESDALVMPIGALDLEDVMRIDRTIHQRIARDHGLALAHVDVRAARQLVLESTRGYTFGMKTAVSIPDDIFERAEGWARRMRQSRSEVYSRALREYVSRHAPDEVTEAMNRVCDAVKEPVEPFMAAAARHVLRRSEW